MKQVLSAHPSRQSVPIALVPSQDYAAWLKRQPAETAAWLNTVGYEGKPGSFCLIPNDQGRVGRVIAALSCPPSLWDLAKLSRCLPQGQYRFEDAQPTALQEKLALGWALGAYRYVRYKKIEAPVAQLLIQDPEALKRAENMAEAIALTRDLINAPANDLGPKELAEAIQTMGRKHNARVSQIVGDDLLRKKFAGIHAVGRASVKPPRLVDLTWGNPRHPKVTLVGKGVTFDSGGLNLKPSSVIGQYKRDMAGAAVAIGAAMTIMAQKMPVRLRLLVPTAENAVGGDAFRPSDVLTMYNGMTVEIGSTDAEGRLLLADALALACEEKPDLIVDFATLTAAARAAVGTHIGAMFANNDELAQRLLDASQETEDPLWRFPLYAPYESMLDSAIADVHSCSESHYGDTIVAALFLQRFVAKQQPWAHVDFMGWNVASLPGRPEGGEATTLRAVCRLIEELSATS